MPTFLVTGGAGFIGSHLCRALLQAQHLVRVLDDLSTGRLANLPSGVAFFRGDINDLDTLWRALDGVDGCFHLAAVASVERGSLDWLGTHRTNLTGTIAVLDAIRGHGALPLVYASSAAVYGNCAELPVSEGAEKRPLSAYGADKYACELHAAVAADVHGIPTSGLRFFNVYGPRQDPSSPYSGVISIFCERLLGGDAVQVFGDGEQTRDFVYVDDVVQALMAAMARVSANPRAIYNVCTGRPVSINRLARTIAELTGGPAEWRRAPPRTGDIRHSVGSPRLARQELGLREPTELRAGLAEVLAWMKQARQAA